MTEDHDPGLVEAVANALEEVMLRWGIDWSFAELDMARAAITTIRQYDTEKGRG